MTLIFLLQLTNIVEVSILVEACQEDQRLTLPDTSSHYNISLLKGITVNNGDFGGQQSRESW